MFLERIERAQGALNAFISVTREQALADAALADRALAAGTGGALTGVPIAHKDMFCTARCAHQLRLAHARQLRRALRCDRGRDAQGAPAP